MEDPTIEERMKEMVMHILAQMTYNTYEEQLDGIKKVALIFLKNQDISSRNLCAEMIRHISKRYLDIENGIPGCISNDCWAYEHVSRELNKIANEISPKEERYE